MVRIAGFLGFSRYLSTSGVSVVVKPKPRASGHTTRPFVDMKHVVVQAGRGGDGCIAFERLFCNSHGGPSGGDGGNGGHVILQADPEVIDFSGLPTVLKAPDGARGSGSHCHGANAKHLYVKVPLDTQIHRVVSKADSSVSAHRSDTTTLLKTLTEASESLVVARGGAGGHGNAFFAIANQIRGVDIELPRIREAALRMAERGAAGQSHRLVLRLTSFADVGLVGAPNAGKSTLLRRLTRARPRVAPHPFTTLKPHVGTLEIPKGPDPEDAVKLSIADLPGLIEGAAERNAGLGAQFLSLIEGCSLLIYLVDVGTFFSSGSGTFPVSEATAHFECQLGMLHRELELFNPKLIDDSAHTALVVGTKIDLVVPQTPEAEGTLKKISVCLTNAAKGAGLQRPEVLLISARRGDHVERLVEILGQKKSRDQ